MDWECRLASAVDDNDRDEVSWTAGTGGHGQWRHYAFVKDANVGLMRIYVDGVLVAQRTGASRPISGPDGSDVRIGARADGASNTFHGKLDELRIYGRALSQAEVVYLAAGQTGEVVQPLVPMLAPADPFADGGIDFRDLAVLGDNWLDQGHWP